MHGDIDAKTLRWLKQPFHKWTMIPIRLNQALTKANSKTSIDEFADPSQVGENRVVPRPDVRGIRQERHVEPTVEAADRPRAQ